MKASDAVTGSFFLAIAVFVFFYAGTFAALPGVKYGPDLFPRLIAVVMGLAGITLIAGALRHAESQPLFTIAQWARQPKSYLIIGAVLGSLVFYIFFSEALGFLLTGFLMLGGLLIATRGRAHIVSSTIIAVCVTVIIYLIFARVLRVPLPLGYIELLMVG